MTHRTILQRAKIQVVGLAVTSTLCAAVGVLMVTTNSNAGWVMLAAAAFLLLLCGFAARKIWGMDEDEATRRYRQRHNADSSP